MMDKNNNDPSKAFVNFPIRIYSSLISKYLPSELVADDAVSLYTDDVILNCLLTIKN